MLRVKTILCLVLVSLLASKAAAVVVTVPGPLFDVEYENSGFMFQTGTFINMDGVEEPFFEQLGGYSILNPTTIRYHLRPEETVQDPADPTIWNIIPGGDIEVGGFPFFTTDMASDTGAFRIIPKPGVTISGVDMMSNGSFANPTEDASLLYSEGLTAGGDNDSAGLSLGIFSAGPLPSGLSTSFPDTNAPVDATFEFDLDGQSSDPIEISFAVINSIDFTITAVPEPSCGVGLLFLLLPLSRGVRR